MKTKFLAAVGILSVVMATSVAFANETSETTAPTMGDATTSTTDTSATTSNTDSMSATSQASQ